MSHLSKFQNILSCHNRQFWIWRFVLKIVLVLVSMFVMKSSDINYRGQANTPANFRVFIRQLNLNPVNVQKCLLFCNFLQFEVHLDHWSNDYFITMAPTRKSLSFLTLKPSKAKENTEFLYRLSDFSSTINRRKSLRLVPKKLANIVSFYKNYYYEYKKMFLMGTNYSMNLDSKHF